MDITNFTLTQWIAWIGAVLVGMILGSIIIPRPVKGGTLSVLLGGILGAIIGAILVSQAYTIDITGIDYRLIAAFFLGALFGTALIKMLFREHKQFRTESSVR